MFGLPNISRPFARRLFASSLISLTFSDWPGSCNAVSVHLDPSKSGERNKMKRCDNLVDVGRRQFLSGAGAATAAVAAATLVTAEAKADTRRRTGQISVQSACEPCPAQGQRAVQRKLSGCRRPWRPDQAGPARAWRCRSRRRRRRLFDHLPAQGFPPELPCVRQDDELPRPLFSLRLRERRSAGLGASHTESSAICSAGRRQRRHLCRWRGRASLRPPFKHPLRESRT